MEEIAEENLHAITNLILCSGLVSGHYTWPRKTIFGKRGARGICVGVTRFADENEGGNISRNRLSVTFSIYTKI